MLQAVVAETCTADCHDVATHVDGLVGRARAHAGCLDDSTTLVDDEFNVALEYLQQEFETNFMHNSDLAQRIRDVKEHPQLLSRPEKDKVARNSSATQQDVIAVAQRCNLYTSSVIHAITSSMRIGTPM